MDIKVYEVRENKCPRCGKVGRLFDTEENITTEFGVIVEERKHIYECICSEHHDQTLFATVSRRVRGRMKEVYRLDN